MNGWHSYDRTSCYHVLVNNAGVVRWGVPDHGELQRLTAIRQPTFVTSGDDDQMIPLRLSHLLGGLIPDARVKIYPDAGHAFRFQHHAEFAADVLGFLAP